MQKIGREVDSPSPKLFSAILEAVFGRELRWLCSSSSSWGQQVAVNLSTGQTSALWGPRGCKDQDVPTGTLLIGQSWLSWALRSVRSWLAANDQGVSWNGRRLSALLNFLTPNCGCGSMGSPLRLRRKLTREMCIRDSSYSQPHAFTLLCPSY